mgnify:FL=1
MAEEFEEELSSEELKAKSGNVDQVSKIIAAINQKYSNNPKEIKSFLKKDDFWQAVAVADPKPAREHSLVYDALSSTLEPVYFWILDFMDNMFQHKVEKLTDNFSSSPGSGHFSELSGKSSHMQQEASRVLATVNSILKGIINLIYDLKEWQIILSHYDKANSKNPEEAKTGILALKQRWLDKVDVQRGNGSIHAMSSGTLMFVTLRDAFMVAQKPEDVNDMDLNERVKMVLKPRLQEFFEWRKRSEQELRKRYSIERAYLRSQVDSLRLNMKWAKPFLKAAEQLRMKDMNNPALVSIFNILVLELTIMATKKLKIEDAVLEHLVPQTFKKLGKKAREYSGVVVVDFDFRGVPNKIGQNYVFGGKSVVSFQAFALNSDELSLLRERLKEADINDSFYLIEGMTEDSLKQIKDDLDEFLKDEDEKKEDEEKKKQANDSNPFSALFSIFKKQETKESKSKEKNKEKAKIDAMKKNGVKADLYIENYLRNVAEALAINNCYTIFDTYKKSHGMASMPYVKAAEGKAPVSKAEKFFRFEKFSQ